MNTTVSFACSACGKCCNSPPLMTVPELLHHEDLFVGTLGVRRHTGGRFDLVTQGLDFPSAGACPARRDDGLCGLHGPHKPAMCRTVPLDPYRAEAQQHVVLLHRNTGAGYIGAECIVPGRHDHLAVLVDDGAVVDPAYRAQWTTHRRLLDDEQQLWGTAVSGMLRRQLPPPPRGAADGLVTLPLVPVLAVLAAWSDRCRERCLRYVLRQRALLERQIDTALARKREQDRPVTAEYRTYLAAYQRLADALTRGGVQAPGSAGEAARAEAYLGVALAA